MLLPQMRLLTMAPFLCLAFALTSFHVSLWIAMLCGTLIDLFSAQLQMGFYALCMTLTALLCYRFRRFFLWENRLTFALYTILFSFCMAIIEILFHALFDHPVPFGMLSLGIHLIVMPILDGIYGILWVFIPTLLLSFLFSKKVALRLIKTYRLMRRRWRWKRA